MLSSSQALWLKFSFCFGDCRTRWGCDDARLGDLGVGGPRGSSKLRRHRGTCSQRFPLSEGWVADPDVDACGWPLTCHICLLF